MAVSVYECSVLADLAYQVGYEKGRSEREPTPGEHVGFRSDTAYALSALGDWTRQYWTADAHTGFVGAIFHRGDDVVVSCRGTVSKRKDLFGSDAKIVLGLPLTNKTEKAYNLLALARQIYPDKTYTMVGHSLGGALVQLVAGVHGCHGVTFNAPGMAEQLEGCAAHGKAGERVVNFRSDLDPVSKVGGAHVGRVYGLAAYAAHKPGLIGSLLQRVNSHSMDVLVKWIGKQSWKDLSPFAPRPEDWDDGSGTCLP